MSLFFFFFLLTGPKQISKGNGLYSKNISFFLFCSYAFKCSILFMHLFHWRDKFHSSTDQKFCLPPLYLSHLGTLVTLGIYSAALFILAFARLKGKQTDSAAAPKLLADSSFFKDFFTNLTITDTQPVHYMPKSSW